VNKMANFKLSNFASSAVSNLSLQKKRTLVHFNCVCYVMWGWILPQDAMFYSIE